MENLVMNEINKETNNEETKAKSKKIGKKTKILLVVMAMSMVIICAVLLYLRDVKVEENQYFVRCYVDYETDAETSVIYCYDADEHEIKEIARTRGYMRRGVVNKEGTCLIALVDNIVILYDLSDGSVLKEVSYSELEKRLGIQTVGSYWWTDFDFTDDGNGVYISMRMEEDDQVYLYDIENDELELIIGEVDFAYPEFVGDYIYYIDYEDDSIKRYHMDTCVTETMVSFSVTIDDFSVSPGGDKILINARIPGTTDELYMYDIDSDNLRVVERGYYFIDIVWNGDSYVYVQQYWGGLADINPSIKMDNEIGIMDKEIYQIKGFLKGGTLWLIENPS